MKHTWITPEQREELALRKEKIMIASFIIGAVAIGALVTIIANSTL